MTQFVAFILATVMWALTARFALALIDVHPVAIGIVWLVGFVWMTGYIISGPSDADRLLAMLFAAFALQIVVALIVVAFLFN
jgi:hypothetical protein